MIAHRKRYGLVLAAAVLCLAGLVPLAAQARDFEIPTFVSPGRTQDLSPSVTAGAHPFELFTHFAIDRSPTADELPKGGFEGPTENVKDLSFELPSGMVASAASFPQCNQEAFNGANCPANTQVGVAEVSLADGQATTKMPIFNMVPPPGIPAQFAYRLLLSNVRIDFHIRSGGDYGLTASLDGLSEAFGILTSSVSIWGVPGDPGHDSLRFTGGGSPAPGPYPEPPPFRALLSNPTSCDGPLATTMEAATWQHPGQLTSAAVFEAPAMSGCGQLDFNPSIEAKTTTNLADSPSGLAVDIHVPQNKDAEGIAAAHLRKVKFMLPAGLTVNPSAANGLGACSASQIGFTGLSNERQLLRYDLPPVKFSGSFLVNFNGQSTAPIPATASRSQVTAALEAIPGLAGNVAIRGSAGGWIVELTGALAGTDVPLMSGTVTDNPSQKLTVSAEGGTFTLSFGGGSTKALPFDASAAEVQSALREIPAIALENLYPGNVFVSLGKVEAAKRSYEVIFAEDLAGPQPTMSATSSLSGAGAGVAVVPVPPPPSHELSVATLGGVAPGTARFTEGAGSCPDSSKIGTARIDAPAVVGHPLGRRRLPGEPPPEPLRLAARLLHQRQRPAVGRRHQTPGADRGRSAVGPADDDDLRNAPAPLREHQLRTLQGLDRAAEDRDRLRHLPRQLRPHPLDRAGERHRPLERHLHDRKGRRRRRLRQRTNPRRPTRRSSKPAPSNRPAASTRPSASSSPAPTAPSSSPASTRPCPRA